MSDATLARICSRPEVLVAGRTPSNLESFQAEMQREGWSVRVASVQEVVEQCEVRAECWAGERAPTRPKSMPAIIESQRKAWSLARAGAKPPWGEAK